MDEQTEKKLKTLRLSNRESHQITRESIEMAMVYLLQEKPIEKITITEIVKRAGVSRTAFYRNFSSKEAVLADVTNLFFEAVANKAIESLNSDRREDFYAELMRIASEYSDILQFLVEVGMFPQHFLTTTDFLSRRFPEVSPEVRYWITLWWGGTLTVILAWYQNGMKESREEMTRFFTSMPVPEVCKTLFVELTPDKEKEDSVI